MAQTLFQMQVSDLTQQVARRFGFEEAYPVLIVTEVWAGGTAAAVGLSPGDLIMRVNRSTVRNMNEFSLEMEKIAAGDTVEIEILRMNVGLIGQMQRRYIVQLKANPTRSKAVTL